jgi:hypothetical protein
MGEDMGDNTKTKEGGGQGKEEEREEKVAGAEGVVFAVTVAEPPIAGVGSEGDERSEEEDGPTIAARTQGEDAQEAVKKGVNDSVEGVKVTPPLLTSSVALHHADTDTDKDTDTDTRLALHHAEERRTGAVKASNWTA